MKLEIFCLVCSLIFLLLSVFFFIQKDMFHTIFERKKIPKLKEKRVENTIEDKTTIIENQTYILKEDEK